MTKQKNLSKEIRTSKAPDLVVTRKEADIRIQERIDKGNKMLNINIQDKNILEDTNTAYEKWNSFNAELLRRIFDTEDIYDEYTAFYGQAFSMDPTMEGFIGELHSEIKDKIMRLETIKERLSLFNELYMVENTVKIQSEKIMSNKVFLVHGRDEAAKQSVARFLEKIGLETVILHEQPNIGRTIIEKFESYSEINYAIVLLTPDDIGGFKTESHNPRARQNVVFELGYFIGKLGRERVCAMYKDGVELPSDFSGILYTLIDEHDAWKLQLVKELKASGFEIDLNKLL